MPCYLMVLVGGAVVGHIFEINNDNEPSHFHFWYNSRATDKSANIVDKNLNIVKRAAAELLGVEPVFVQAPHWELCLNPEG